MGIEKLVNMCVANREDTNEHKLHYIPNSSC
jgi:hypothetical protein